MTSSATLTSSTESPTISVIIVSHEQPFDDLLAQMAKQTHQPDEIILVSCCLDISRYEVDKKVLLNHRNDWGHEARSTGLKLAEKDYVLFANSDDEYLPEFIEKLLAMNVDLAYCNWDEQGRIQESYPSLGTITSGNFIVKRELAQEVGWNHRDYIGDGKFVMEVMERFPTHANLPEVLYYHR